jgi:hypothetical protein
MIKERSFTLALQISLFRSGHTTLDSILCNPSCRLSYYYTAELVEDDGEPLKAMSELYHTVQHVNEINLWVRNDERGSTRFYLAVTPEMGWLPQRKGYPSQNITIDNQDIGCTSGVSPLVHPRALTSHSTVLANSRVMSLRSSLRTIKTCVAEAGQSRSTFRQIDKPLADIS